MNDFKNNEFILFDDKILNVGSILQCIPNADWEWDEKHENKEMMFTMHFLGGGSLSFPMSKYEEIKKILVKDKKDAD